MTVFLCLYTIVCDEEVHGKHETVHVEDVQYPHIYLVSEGGLGHFRLGHSKTIGRSTIEN